MDNKIVVEVHTSSGDETHEFHNWLNAISFMYKRLPSEKGLDFEREIIRYTAKEGTAVVRPKEVDIK